jgi:hypothetical protein
MGEIKFVNIRLLDCKARIDHIVMELQKNADEALMLIGTIEPNKQHGMMNTIKSISATIDEMRVMSAKLARLAEHYREGERSVEDIVRRLFVPVPIQSQQSSSLIPMHFSSDYSVSLTMPKDIIVESWILELMLSEMIGGT